MAVDGVRVLHMLEGVIGAQRRAMALGSSPKPGLVLSQALGPFTVSVAAATAITVWQASQSPLTRFDYAEIVAGAPPTVDALADDGTMPDVIGALELTCNDGDAAEQIFVLPIREFLVQTLLGDASRYGIAAGGDGFAASADVIDKIRYKNLSATDAHDLTIFLGAA